MKYLFFLLALAPTCLNAQAVWNTDCSTAWFLNDVAPNASMSFDVTGTGTGGQTVLYYYFRSNGNHTGASIATVSATNGVTPLAVSYVLYDPYDSQTNACTDISLRMAGELTNGLSTSSQTVTADLDADMTYVLKIVINSYVGNLSFVGNGLIFRRQREEVGCMDCITGFKPGPGTYILSAWVKDNAASGSATNYTTPSVIFNDGITATTCNSSGDIIDGWQRIEKEVTVGATSPNVTIKLNCAIGGDCYYDDIRIHPIDGSMVTYVYDPTTLRLMAEMDERNYAKYYEYDEEGKLIRVKKETEEGIMTIQETRENNSGQ